MIVYDDKLDRFNECLALGSFISHSVVFLRFLPNDSSISDKTSDNWMATTSASDMVKHRGGDKPITFLDKELIGFFPKLLS